MSAIDSVRILVLGDSGVGKTSFVHLAANAEPVKDPRWTVGCSVEVKLHVYKEGTPGQKTYFVELWDVGGSKNHKNTRHVFYKPCHGVILVHDLTNSKSEENLKKWLMELLNKDNLKVGSEDWDVENFFCSTKMPILVIGTKLDLTDEKKYSSRSDQSLTQFGAEEILLDCRQSRYLAAGTSSAVKVSRFFDRVIENRYHSENYSYVNHYSTPTNTLPSKFFSPTHQD